MTALAANDKNPFPPWGKVRKGGARTRKGVITLNERAGVTEGGTAQIDDAATGQDLLRHDRGIAVPRYDDSAVCRVDDRLEAVTLVVAEGQEHIAALGIGRVARRRPANLLACFMARIQVLVLVRVQIADPCRLVVSARAEQLSRPKIQPSRQGW